MSIPSMRPQQKRVRKGRAAKNRNQAAKATPKVAEKATRRLTLSKLQARARARWTPREKARPGKAKAANSSLPTAKEMAKAANKNLPMAKATPRVRTANSS